MSSLESPPASSNAGRPLIFDHLPVFPAVALELINLMDQPESSMHQITGLLRRDPAVAAEVLRTSNSARYIRHKEEITSLDTALVVIGLAEARRVSLNAAVRGMIGGALGLPELRHCWAHCIAVAILSEEMASDRGERDGPAYVAGLLHDLGVLALLAMYPKEYRRMIIRVKRGDADWRTAEKDIFGLDHEEVGGMVLEEMGLPVSLKPILEKHHDVPDLSAPGMLALVATADQIANSLGFGIGASPSEESVDALFESVAHVNPNRRPEDFDRVRERILEATA